MRRSTLGRYARVVGTDRRCPPSRVGRQGWRHKQSEIEGAFKQAGFAVIWSRFVRAGHWDEPLENEDGNAKQVLLLCRPQRDHCAPHRISHTACQRVVACQKTSVTFTT